MGLRWARAGARLVSSSYEGTIRSLDVQNGVSEELLNWEGFRCSTFDFAETSGGTCGEALYAAGTNGCLVLVDPREKRSRGEEHVVHDKKINTVSVDPGGSGLLATSSQGEVCVWDVRRLSGKAVRTLAHTRSCQAAYFAPDGSQRVLTTCYDDCLRVFGSNGTQPEVRSRHHGGLAPPRGGDILQRFGRRPQPVQQRAADGGVVPALGPRLHGLDCCRDCLGPRAHLPGCGEVTGATTLGGGLYNVQFYSILVPFT